jgi:hypothetical protein
LKFALDGSSSPLENPVDLPEMAEQVGNSQSQVSREFIDAGERLLQELAERDCSEADLIAIDLDGVQFTVCSSARIT